MRQLSLLLRLLALWLLVALLFWGLTAILPGVEVPGLAAALATTAAIAVVNALLWPALIRILLPLAVLSFGLLALVLNAALVVVAIEVIDGEAPGVGAAFATAFLVSVASMLLTPALSLDDDARVLRIVRRRARAARRQNTTDVPGVIMFEIDGLAEPVLERALAEGHVPNIAAWLEEGSHKLIPWECDLSSQTGASQAGLLLGSNEDMPAFRWYEKETGRMMVSNRVGDAAELERRHSSGAGLLSPGGTSRGNLFSGGALRCSATMSVIRDRERSSAKEYLAYFADPYAFTRTLARVGWDVWLERRAARRQRRAGAEHVDRGGAYPFMRAAITVVMRDLNVATLLGDIVEGVPVSYSTFVGYDEVAHHSGVEEPDAFAVLKQHDAQLGRLQKALALAPRPYHLVVLSDHGQSQGRPFKQRYGQELAELVNGSLAAGDVFAPPAVDEGATHVGTALTDARHDDSPAGRLVARATRDRLVDGQVVVGPTGAAEDQAADAGGHEAIVLASGGLGLVYLTSAAHRMTLEEIEAAHPQLLPALSSHPGIGFVMAAGAAGPVVIGPAGTRTLADDSVTGTDPLADFGPNAAHHLRRTDGFAHCPDLLVNCMYDRDANEVAPFEDFMGSHGGLGGWQSRPFAVVPSEWSDPAAPIIGAEEMHRVLEGWLRETGLET